MYSHKYRYQGNAARIYESKRARELSWAREDSIVKKLCQGMAQGSKILDIPCGTGRFFPLYQLQGHLCWGADISLDMLVQIPASRRNLASVRGLVQCDAERLPFADRSFDYVVCLRFFHFLPAPTACGILKEFARVAKKGIILHIPLTGRSLFVRLFDAWSEAIHSRQRAPAILVKKATTILARAKKTRLRPPSPLSESPGPDANQVFLPGLAELESIVEEHGFRISGQYGAVSPLSSKKICLIERQER